MGKSPCFSDEKVELKKGPWTPEEDQKLTDYIQKHGHGRWRTLPNNAGLKRCGKSCRLRWINYLRPDIKRGRFSLEEEDTIIQLHSVLGNKWSTIASHLPGRTDNEIKNYWNTIIRKKLLKMGIDPVTHAPCLDLLELSSLLGSALIYNNLSSYQLNTDLPNHHDQLGINHYNNPLFKHPQVVQNSSSILQLQNNHISDVQTTATSTGLGQLISQNLSNLLSSYSPNSYLWQNNTSEASITPNYESFIVPLQQNHSYKDLVTTPSSNPLNSNSPTNYVNCSSTTTEGERDSFYHNILMYDISTDLNHTNQHYNN